MIRTPGRRLGKSRAVGKREALQRSRRAARRREASGKLVVGEGGPTGEAAGSAEDAKVNVGDGIKR